MSRPAGLRLVGVHAKKDKTMSEIEREIPSPVVELPNGDNDPIRLHYLNTRLRTFKDESLDHIEYTTEDGQTLGLRVGRAVLDILFENEFPMQFDPFTDQSTIDWFTRSEMKGLDEELDELGGE